MIGDSYQLKSKSAHQGKSHPPPKHTSAPHPSGPRETILTLQRTAGNQAVQRLLRASPMEETGIIQRQASKKPLEREEKLAEKAVAEGMYRLGKLLMDDEGWEIADRWFQGKTDEVVFEGENWKKYMMRDKKLKKQITDQLSGHALSMRTALLQGYIRLDGNVLLQFHGEVGSKEGGFFSGYELLHGTNATVGDFQVRGPFSIHRSGGSTGMTIAYYSNLEFIFNDIVDLNRKYAADVLFGRIGRNIAKVKGTGPPRDYIIRIKWHADFEVVIGPQGQVVAAGYATPVGSRGRK